ncbi:hypothetical protein GWR56_13850 [Mucilaginibacter sp. 14171R-50]|uniref:hypothetical protein n=1 Tax=Mucilaginibacter sp. 14171R-50 TaxID=2703789 RepID=UPI00138B996E|nr:hypothetical protein [Mucilaginibacter sp. 14171R-50]QHS56573.1 hypothetical protein GWR56_13850 [Mucilaginibacter sp. 14171R-50]
MIQIISWQQYVTAVFLFAIAWYSYVGLRYYRPEIAALLRIKPSVQRTMPAVAGKLTAVMGQAKPEADTGLYPPEELLFSGSEPDDISDQTLPKGPSDDLLAEAQVLAGACSDKTEFLSLFKLLLSKYEAFADEISLSAVIRSLQLPFEIQAEEWPQTFVA